MATDELSQALDAVQAAAQDAIAAGATPNDLVTTVAAARVRDEAAIEVSASQIAEAVTGAWDAGATPEEIESAVAIALEGTPITTVRIT